MAFKQIYLIAFLIICATFSLTDCTKCKPFSKFKIDCNICQCGEDGTKYFCTRWPCEQLKDFVNDEGYNLGEKLSIEDNFLSFNKNDLNEENIDDDLLGEGNDDEDHRMIPNKIDADVLYNDLQNMEKDNNDLLI